MSCTKYHRMISLLVDGELHPSATEELQRHMDRCSDCRSFHERAQSLSRRVQAAKVVLPNSASAERVKDRLRSLRSGRPARQLLPSWIQLPLVAAVLLCALGIGNYAGRSLTEVLVPASQQNSIELLVMENGPSFADVILDIGQQESTE